MEVDQHVQSDNATKRTHICTTKSTFLPLGYQCDVQSDTPTSAMQTPPFLEFCNSALIIERLYASVIPYPSVLYNRLLVSALPV